MLSLSYDNSTIYLHSTSLLFAFTFSYFYKNCEDYILLTLSWIISRVERDEIAGRVRYGSQGKVGWNVIFIAVEMIIKLLTLKNNTAKLETCKLRRNKPKVYKNLRIF